MRNTGRTIKSDKVYEPGPPAQSLGYAYRLSQPTSLTHFKLIWIRHSREFGILFAMTGALIMQGCHKPGGVDLWEAIAAEDIDAINRYANAGGDLNVVNDEGSTALIFACESDKETIFTLLLELGADPNIMTENAHTATNCAASKDSASWLRTALEHSASPNVLEAETPGKTKRSPLGWALTHKRFENTKLLIEAGADVSAVDEFGDTPLHYAVGRRRYDIVMFLLEHDADYRHETPGRTSFIELMGTRRIETLRDPEMKKGLLATRDWLRQHGVETEEK